MVKKILSLEIVRDEKSPNIPLGLWARFPVSINSHMNSYLSEGCEL